MTHPRALGFSRLALLTFSASLLVCPASGQEAAPAKTTLLGVVDEAGVLTPVVRFDGARWRNTWPDPDEKLADLTLPSSLRTVPTAWAGMRPPAVWYIWPRHAAASGANAPGAGGSATAPRTVNVTRPVRYAAHCIPGIGLQSDLRGPEPRTEANTFPKRKLAIAVSNADLRVEPLSDVRADDPATRDLLRTAATYFRANVARAGEPAHMHLSSKGLRVRWGKMWSYAVPDSDERVYLLEGYASTVLELSGFLWIRTKNAMPVEHRGRVVINDDSYKTGTTRVAMGVVSLGERRFWLSTVSGYESEDYELIEISSPRFPLALKMSVGGC